jgi:hypothetical protein
MRAGDVALVAVAEPPTRAGPSVPEPPRADEKFHVHVSVVTAPLDGGCHAYELTVF